MSYGRGEFAAEFDVPRETMPLFDAYAERLAAWQAHTNLVGPSTLPDIWNRHFRDSAQLLSLAPATAGDGLWLDVGSGAGFPGLVIALLAGVRVALVEAKAKKCRFLQELVEAFALSGQVQVLHGRVERLPLRAAIISARACAPLERILGWTLHCAAPDSLWLLPKGRTAETELANARRLFDFEAVLVPSRSGPDGHIVVARDVRRRRQG